MPDLETMVIIKSRFAVFCSLLSFVCFKHALAYMMTLIDFLNKFKNIYDLIFTYTLFRLRY